MATVTEIHKRLALIALGQEHPTHDGGRMLNVAQALADAVERENRNCEAAALGESCDVNANCGHLSCQYLHAAAHRIAVRRST